MKKLAITLFILILLALNWAVLHDILKGQPDVGLEWSFVIGSALLLVVVLIRKKLQAT